MEYWKKKHVNYYNQKLELDTKIFILKGHYPWIRQSLLDRGWVENPDTNSPVFDFKWTLKSIEAYTTNLNDN